MGLLSNPLRPREPGLPTYRRAPSPTKERLSDDLDRYSSDYDSDSYASDESPSSSRTASGSMSSGHLMLPKRNGPSQRRAARVYPYKLPARVTRYVALGIAGILILMIMSLIRASQVENWKVANGKIDSRPPPPPVWEGFPFLERYYGGLRTLLPFKESRPEYPSHNDPAAFDPTAGQAEKDEPAADSRDATSTKPWEPYSGADLEEDAQECFINTGHRIRVPSIHYHSGRPEGFPQSVVGSYDVLNLPEDICFDRFGRFGPYGFGYSVRKGGLGTGEHGDTNGTTAIWEKTPQVDFRDIDWADVQRRCFQTNAARFKAIPEPISVPHGFYIQDGKTSTLSTREVGEQGASNASSVLQEHKASDDVNSAKNENTEVSKEKKSRTAVVVRCWDEYLFREDDIANIRSIISELALASGSRYDIHLLVQVKNDAAHPIWADHETYQKRINDVIPKEFRGLVTLWTETQMLSLYQGVYDLYSRGPELPVHGVYRGLSMAMQYFAYMHPEYDFFWQWEMDVRYTGHYYDFFTKVEQWTKAQPRKGLWERNERFYLPDVHGSWEDFSQMARVQSEMGTVGSDNLWKGISGAREKNPEKVTKNGRTVWGPKRAPDDNDWFEPGKDPIPTSGYDKDHYDWGVGEEADYISLNPIFDPEGTTWLLKDDITGFNRSKPTPPRRANIITTSRLSRRLLMTMHKMTAHKKQFAFPEMWPATVALQHGYKAVYAPHPVYVDRRWPVEFMAQTYNGGKDGASGGSRSSIFGEREHHLRGLSWFYNSGFAPNMYRRWMGLRVNNDGGEEFENIQDQSKQGGSVGSMPGGEGRMCLPPMLLHPVKDVVLPVEAPVEEEEQGVPVSDPTA